LKHFLAKILAFIRIRQKKDRDRLIMFYIRLQLCFKFDHNLILNMQDLENITEATGNIIWGTAEKSDRDNQKKEDEERIKEYNRSFVAMIYFVKKALMKKDI